jgi:chaperonin cofactor prefoldin
VDEESVATRAALDELKEDLRNPYEETKQKIDVFEKKVKTMEKKFDDLFERVLTIMQNICTSLLDSRGYKMQIENFIPKNKSEN